MKLCIVRNGYEAGVTLIELMVTIAIMGILFAIALPNYQQFVIDTRMTAQANDFLSMLSFTRSEAVKRNTRVSICKSSDGATCVTTGNWQQGWIVFVDGGTAGTFDGTDSILKVHVAFTGNSTLVGSANVANFVSYMSNGQASLAGTFDLCGTLATVAGRDITLDLSGRTSVVRDEPPVTCS